MSTKKIKTKLYKKIFKMDGVIIVCQTFKVQTHCSQMITECYAFPVSDGNQIIT